MALTSTAWAASETASGSRRAGARVETTLGAERIFRWQSKLSVGRTNEGSRSGTTCTVVHALARVCSLESLDLRSGETLGLYPKPFSAASGDEGLEILNLTGRPQTFRLIVESGSPSSTTLDATGSGPFTLPAGGRERFLRLATGELRVMLDADNNGEPESNEPAVQTALYNGTVPAGADCNQNGIADALDIASGAFPDLNGNLVPDICEAVPPLPAMGIVGHSVKNGILTVNLSLEGTPGSRWMIQRSADLSKWTDVSSVTLGTSAVIQSVTEPDTSTRVYFRASFQP